MPLDRRTLTESDRFRRCSSPAARERWEKRITAHWQTFGWSKRGSGWSEEAARRRSRGGGVGWPTPASSSELEPARLGLPASLEVEEDGTELGQGTAGAEVVHQRRSRARRQWRRGGVAEKGGFMREGLSWGLYRLETIARKAMRLEGVQN